MEEGRKGRESGRRRKYRIEKGGGGRGERVEKDEVGGGERKR